MPQCFTLLDLLSVWAPTEFVILWWADGSPWDDTNFICHDFAMDMAKNQAAIPYLNNTVVGISGMDDITCIIVSK